MAYSPSLVTTKGKVMPICIATTEALCARLVFSGYKHSFSKSREVCGTDILAVQIIPPDCFSSKKVCKFAWVYGCALQLAPHKKKRSGRDFPDTQFQNQVKQFDHNDLVTSFLSARCRSIIIVMPFLKTVIFFLQHDKGPSSDVTVIIGAAFTPAKSGGQLK